MVAISSPSIGYATTYLRIRSKFLSICHLRPPDTVLSRVPADIKRSESQQREPARVREHVQQRLHDK